MYNSDSLAYLLGSYKDTQHSEGADEERRDLVSSDLQTVPERDSRGKKHRPVSRPPVVGESLFTQEDINDVQFPQNSLLEFEEYEAAVTSDGSDNVDLIGQYLKGLAEQDDFEEQENGIMGRRRDDFDQTADESVLLGTANMTRQPQDESIESIDEFMLIPRAPGQLSEENLGKERYFIIFTKIVYEDKKYIF